MSEIKLPEDIQNDIRKSAEDALLWHERKRGS